MMGNQLHTIFVFFFFNHGYCQNWALHQKKGDFQTSSLIFYIERNVTMKFNTKLIIDNFKDLKEHQISF